MTADQFIIIRLSADQKNYTYWVQDTNGQPIRMGNGLPEEPLNALGNRTTSKSTLGTNIQNEMPTLST